MTTRQAFELAQQHQQAGRLTEAATLYRQVLQILPKQAETHHRLGVIDYQLGQYESAATSIRHALTLNPNNAGAWSNLGETYRAMDRMEEAIACYRRALQLQPNLPAVLNNLGMALGSLARLDEAVAMYRRALELQPDYSEAHNNLGNILSDKHLIDDAIAAYQQALHYKPEFAIAWNNLGIALAERGRLEEAVDAYQRALEIQPDYPQAQNNLGSALSSLGRVDEAMASLRTAIDRLPDYAEAHYNLGNAFKQQGRPEQAEASFRRALELRPEYAEFNNNLGNVLTEQGRLDEALAAFRRALELRPQNAWVHSNLIYTLHFHPHPDDAAITGEQQRWNRQFGGAARPFVPPHSHSRDPKRQLRIGYVSPDFRIHAVGLNLAPLFQHHDDREFEIVCYSEVLRPDELTEKFRAKATRWHNILGLSDEAFAGLIREDGIDLLVDLTQHMARNRLPLFARQPAPVQISFAGYPESTGLDAIRCRISDRYLESGTKPTEEVHLIDSYWCYDPCGIDLAANELPALKNGHVTFGCLNNFCKVNEPLLTVWAQVLGRVKDSRLILLSREGSHRQRALDVLARGGIEAHRVEFADLRPREQYFELYHRLDIALDPFPYNGHTTSLDALWMGVPVISRAGARAVGRAGLSQLTTAGFPEFVAHSEEAYVAIAASLATDPQRLATLRATLRPTMAASPLMDASLFARNIEAAYRAMWREWCAAK